MAGFNSVADLKPFKTMWRVKVSIVRLWKQYSAPGGLTIEMVLIDSNGDKIHASVKKELVNQFEHQLEQGKTLTFTSFSLNHSVGSYRTDDKPSLQDQCVVHNAYVIGHVVEVSHVEMISVNGKDTQKISLELRDLADVRLPMVLWGNFATDVTNAIPLRGEGRVVLVLRFGKIKVWKEDRSVSNAYNVSDVQLNPNMAEVEAFRAMLPADELQLAIVESKPLTVTSGVSVKDDFFIHTPRKTIAEMIECGQSSIMNREQHNSGKENPSDHRPPKRQKQDSKLELPNKRLTPASGVTVQTQQPVYNTILLADVTNSNDLLQRNARTQREIQFKPLLLEIWRLQLICHWRKVTPMKLKISSYPMQQSVPFFFYSNVVIKCVAYGALAHVFNDLWNSIDADIVLCVLQCWQINWRQGRLKKVTNIDGFSKIVFDPTGVP
ncbi:hypothetical protein F2Q69_00048755 [Brassica cretica]|uniref:Replication protein A 70 kDa DNA-binding subunit B/D first OB fold domain-containing protein n=1 Tax=Brassica cretica TaxID=69181 RepID=A0A8S9PWX1_BRACR|nr:hypothetical protein F2Q69_00048755 [Brassica cretica]